MHSTKMKNGNSFWKRVFLISIPLPSFSLFVKPHFACKGDWRKRF